MKGTRARYCALLLAALALPAASPEKPMTKIETPSRDELAARLAEPPALVMARSEADLAIKTRFAQDVWRIGDPQGQWAVDLKAGTIRFSNPKLTATAPVQVIGTYNTKDGTWLWGWDHPSVPAPVAEAAKAMQAYGERHGLAVYTTRKIACSEADAWKLAAVASYLTGAQGAYRGPSGTTLVFMTFGTVTLGKPDRSGL